MAIPKLVVDPHAEAATPVPHGRLLDIIGLLPLGNTQGAEERWINGVTWQPLPCRPMKTGAVDVCNPALFTATDYGCTSAESQVAFQVYDAFVGSSLEYEIGDLDSALRSRARTITSWVFAKELIDGNASAGMSLASEAHAPADVAFGSGAVSVRKALSVLEEDLASTLYGAQGVIHMPVTVLAEAVAEAGVHLMGDQYVTVTGHKVVADGGYVNGAGPDGQAAASSSQAWIYSSGPVWYRSSEPDLLGSNGSEVTNITRNILTRWLSSYGILVFDPCPVSAILATVGT